MSAEFGAISPPDSLLVVRLGAMGDVIHTLAAVTAMRSAFPKMRIGWVIEERWAELLCSENTLRSGVRSDQRPVADFVHAVDTKGWRRSLLSRKTRHQIADVWREIAEQRYELAADFQGALKSAFIARLPKAKSIVGFEHPRETPARFLYKQRVRGERTHVIEQYRSLAEAIAGRPLPHCAPRLPRDPTAESSVAKRLSGLSGSFVLINPGAGWGAKQWPAERYAEVARGISRLGVTSLINFGPGEQGLASSVQHASGGIALPISCSIPELIGLTRRVRLFIGSDTGPLHLAAALGVPVVAIFGPTDPARNGPYGTKSIVLRDPDSKTSLSHTRTPDPGLLKITAEEVIAAAGQLLENPNA